MHDTSNQLPKMSMQNMHIVKLASQNVNADSESQCLGNLDLFHILGILFDLDLT